MDIRAPRNDLRLVARAIEEDLGFVALADTSSVLAAAPSNAYRLIGGHMVTLHAHRWNLGNDLYRDTNDADLGIVPAVALAGDLEPALRALGYAKTTGAQFRRPVADIPGALVSASSRAPQVYEATVDIVFPAYRTHVRESRGYGQLVSIEIRGLAEALNRPPVQLDLTLIRLNRQEVRGRVLLPDEIDALALKALAWDARKADKDAVDIWRCLEIVAVTDVGTERFNEGDSAIAKRIVERDFVDERSPGMVALARGRNLNVSAHAALHTRVTALVARTFGSS